MRKIKGWLLIVGLAFCLFGLRGVAEAQYTPNYTTNIGTTMINSYYSPAATMNRMERARLAARRGNSSGRNSSSNTTPRSGGGGSTTTTTTASGSTSGRTTSTNSGTTTFRPVADMIAPKQIANDVGKTPQERTEIEERCVIMLKKYREALAYKGLPPNEVSRAASYLVRSSYEVAYDGRDMSETQYNALRDYMRQVFLEDEKFQSMTDRERQINFENYAIVGSWIDYGYHIAKEDGNAYAMKRFREMARQNFQSMMGVPPERVKFTESGVEYQ